MGVQIVIALVTVIVINKLNKVIIFNIYYILQLNVINIQS